MTFGKWTRVLLFAAPFVAGCAGFWVNPSSTSTTNTSFSLSNSGNLSVSPGATTGNTSTITVTPANSFTGTVDVACTVSSAPSGATSPTTCSVSPTSVSITSGAAAPTTTLTATTSSTTTTGNYNITVTGTSGSLSATTSLCVAVSTTSATCTAATASGVFYILDSSTNQVDALSISSSGTLNTISSTVLAGTPQAIAVAPNGRFLYVSTTAGIFLFGIDSTTGALTLGNNNQAIIPNFPATAMVVDATNSWLLEVVSGSTQLSAFSINSNNGLFAVAGESPVPFTLPATTPLQLAISPDSSSCSNCYVFVAMGSGGTEFIRFNPGNSSPFGAAGTQGLVTSSGGANAVAVDPQNRLLYIGEANALPSTANTGGLRVFTLQSNGITELRSAGSPYTIGASGPISILPTSDGNFVYVEGVSAGADVIASFSVATTGLTSVGAPITAQVAGNVATGNMKLVEDSTGTYLLAIGFSGNPDLQAFTTNAGVLTSVQTPNIGTTVGGAVAIAALP